MNSLLITVVFDYVYMSPLPTPPGMHQDGIVSVTINFSNPSNYRDDDNIGSFRLFLHLTSSTHLGVHLNSIRCVTIHLSDFKTMNSGLISVTFDHFYILFFFYTISGSDREILSLRCSFWDLKVFVNEFCLKLLQEFQSCTETNTRT
jgi:hypothetical protein